MDNLNSLREAIYRPVYLLWIIRQNAINSFEQLCDHFGEHAESADYLQPGLRRLHEVGLIEWNQENGLIAITIACGGILNILEASLTEQANRSQNSMTVNPLFHRPLNTTDRADVFVLMPFSQELKPVYEDHLKKVCKDSALSIARADDFFNTNEVMSDVWKAIIQSRVIVADCTGRNPNVFYELGIAHTVGKPVILLTQNEQDIPFDIRHRRYIKYNFTPRGMDQLERSLSSTLQDIIKDDSDQQLPRSPLS